MINVHNVAVNWEVNLQQIHAGVAMPATYAIPAGFAMLQETMKSRAGRATA